MNRSYRSAIVLAVAAGAFLFLLYVLRQTLLLIWVSVLIAILLSPIVDWISQLHVRGHHPGRGFSLLILIVSAAVMTGLFFWLAIPPIVRDARGLSQQWPQHIQRLVNWAHQRLPVTSKLDATDIRHYAAVFASGLGGMFKNLTSGIVGFATVLLLSAYFILDGAISFRWMISLFPARHQERLRSTLLQGASRMRRWLAGQGLLMLIHGGSSTLVFWLLHVRYFYVLGVLAGLFNIIPVLGPVLTLIVAGLVATIDSFSKLLGVVTFYLIYHNLENALLNPRIMQWRVQLPAVAVVVALVVGDALAGIVGILIAVPTAALIAVVLNEYVVQSPPATALPNELEDRAA